MAFLISFLQIISPQSNLNLHSKDTGSENFKKELLSFDFVATAKISGCIIKMMTVNSTVLANINII